VKEHPVQWIPQGWDSTGYRYEGYYDAIARLPNTYLVPIETSSFVLTRHAKAVATISGMVGWEAVLRGVPVIVFGYPWFMHAPGVFKVSNTAACTDALQKIAAGFSVSTQRILNYVGAMDRVSIRANSDEYGKRISGIGEEESARNMTRALEEALVASSGR
jgi:hypothetical protein